MAKFISFETKATSSQLERISHRIKPAAMLAMKDAVLDAEEYAKGTTSFKDHRGADGTRASIRGLIYHGDMVEGSLSGHQATRFLTFGTKAHGPVTAPFLVFKVNGSWVRTRWVRGIVAKMFMQEAAIIGSHTLHDQLGHYVNQAISSKL